MVKVTLSKPVSAHGDEVTVLTFREPTCEDIVACGYPLVIGEDGALPQAGAIVKYIARLGGIPPSSAKALSALDFTACMKVILPFFGELEPSGQTSGNPT